MRLIMMLCWFGLLSGSVLAQETQKTEEDPAKVQAYKTMLARINEARFLYNDKKYEEALAGAELFLTEYELKDENKERVEHLDETALKQGRLEAQLLVVDCYHQLRQIPLAKEFTQKQRSAKASLTDYVMEANLLLWARDKEKSMAVLEQARELNEADYMVWFFMGRVAYHQRDIDKAVAMYKKAIELNPDFAEPYYELGRLALRNQDKALVRTYFSEYLKRIPHKGERYEYVNDTLRRLGG